MVGTAMNWPHILEVICTAAEWTTVPRSSIPVQNGVPSGSHSEAAQVAGKQVPCS